MGCDMEMVNVRLDGIAVVEDHTRSKAALGLIPPLGHQRRRYEVLPVFIPLLLHIVASIG
jgi:hypothetical protein